MKRLGFLYVFLFAVFFSYTAFTQELGSIRNNYVIEIPEKIQVLPGEPPLAAGTYSIGAGGYFATIGAAFNKISRDGIAGAVTLELINNIYFTPADEYGFLLNGPISGAGPNSRVTIKPAENKNVTIVCNSRYSLVFLNTSYLTLDGVGLTGPTTLTIRARYKNIYASNDCVQFWNNSSYNIIQNITFKSEDYMRYGCGILLWNQPNSLTPPNNNLILNNYIKEAGVGICIMGYGEASTSPNNNVISGNKIGSETDNLIAWGIQSEITLNTIIENNIVQNIRYYNDYINPGINVYGGYGNIIRNNLVHNISTDGGIYGGCGILLSGSSWPGLQGSNHLVYNNMIYDIQSSSMEAGACVSGIQMWNQYAPKIYYNSVFLTGKGHGANPEGSSALLAWGGCSNVIMKNNIFVNLRDDSLYCASSVCFMTQTSLTSDHNDLYYLQNQINCLVDYGVSDYHTLAEWQATGQDINSVTEKPHFVDSPYLHINHHVPTYLESRGIPIGGIDTDFDGDYRNVDPSDIGADEFDGVSRLTDIEDNKTSPTRFTLEQNYPNPFNPSTVISYQLPASSDVTLKVYDILGNEAATLVNEYQVAGKYEVEFNSHSSNVQNLPAYRQGLPSGVYFYQIKAGEYVNTKKMILLK